MTQLSRHEKKRSFSTEDYPPLTSASSRQAPSTSPSSRRLSRPLPMAPTSSNGSAPPSVSGYNSVTAYGSRHSPPSSSHRTNSSYGGKSKDRKGSYDTKEPNPDYKIISFKNTSQYSKGGPSSCGLAAVNASSRILPMIGTNGAERDIMEVLELEDTATSIMSICSFWDSDDHLEVQDILNLPLFDCHLETLRVVDDQCSLTNFRRLTRSLANDGPSAAIICKPPEIVCLMNLPSTKPRKSWRDMEEETHNVTVIFDSHPRPEHPLGAAFLVFPSSDSAASYLSQLFKVDTSLLDADLGWQGQLLARFSAHVLRARQTTDEEEMDAVYEANIRLLDAGVQMREATLRESAAQSELNEIKDRLERTKEKRRDAIAQEADAEKRLRELKTQLESAKETADILRQNAGMDLPAYDMNERRPQGLVDEKGKGRQREQERAVPRQALNVQRNGFGSGIMDDEVAAYERARQERLGIAPKRQSSTDEAGAYEQTRQERFSLPAKGQSNAKHASVSQRSPQVTSYASKPKPLTPPDSPTRATKPPAAKTTGLDDRTYALKLQQQLESERDDFEKARQMQMEEDRARLLHERLTQTVDKGFECKICMDMWQTSAKIIVDGCEHEVCPECMRGNIKAELDHKRWPVLCPLCRANPDAKHEPGVIHRNIVELVITDEEMLKRWTEIELSVVSVRIECPSCKKEAPLDAKDFEEAEMLHCLHNCGAYWCKKCMQPGERGKTHTCNGDAEFDRWREAQGDVRQCPGCKMPIQRNEGCRHMTCTQPGCNTHFCDICGQLLIKSQKKKEIDAAVQRHYSGQCKLFDYGPE